MRRLAPRDILGCPGHDDLAAGVTTFGPEVDDVIGGLDDVHVVLDEDDGVAGVHQLIQ